MRYIAGIVLGMLMWSGLVPAASAMMVSPNMDASSYSVEQLESLIAKLQSQLAEMKKGSLCFVSDQELSLGDGEDGSLSDDVRRLQSFLGEKGVFAYKASGYFGKATRASLIAWQKKQGLTASGVFDAATKEQAHAMTCKKVTKTTVKQEEKKVTQSDSTQTGGVKSITVKTADRSVLWTLDGYSKYGFKVVWSKNPSPTYPTREGDQYQYFDSPQQADAKLTDFNGNGTYYVRVCEYLGGACGVYSNEVKIQL